jgi:hypothetical protein
MLFPPKNKKIIIILAAIFLLALLSGILIFFLNGPKNKVNQRSGQPAEFKGLVINDNVKIPNTVSIADNEGEIVPRGEYNVKLQPQSEQEQVLITNAKLTLKEAYAAVASEVNFWAPDARLVFIKSNGAVGLDGRSSSWQLVFSSSEKGSAYEIITAADKIISQKEIASSARGHELPLNWYDSSEAIASLRYLPQFSADTISAISFYYSAANASWAYGLAQLCGSTKTLGKGCCLFLIRHEKNWISNIYSSWYRGVNFRRVFLAASFGRRSEQIQ